MRKKNTESIGEVLRQYFDENKFLKVKLAESRIINGWKDILGKTIASYTSGLYIRNGVLYISLTSSVLRSELSLAKDDLIKKLNDYAGLTVVKDIVLK